MKISGILSIVSVIAAFAAFSPDVKAMEDEMLLGDLEPVIENLDTPGCLGACVYALEDAKMKIRCKNEDDCKIKLTSDNPDCKACKVKIKKK